MTKGQKRHFTLNPTGSFKVKCVGAEGLWGKFSSLITKTTRMVYEIRAVVPLGGVRGGGSGVD